MILNPDKGIEYRLATRDRNQNQTIRFKLEIKSVYENFENRVGKSQFLNSWVNEHEKQSEEIFFW